MTRSRVSSEQLDQLLSFMEEHREFAVGKQSIYSRFSSNKLWRLLAEKLNACEGGARKSPDKWCRYWSDIKYKSKKKTSHPGGLAELSEIEERLKNIVGVSTKDYSTATNSHSDEERKPALLDDNIDDMDQEGMTDPIERVDLGTFGEPKLSTEEILAEAAMRSALAAEKQAEAVTQAVDLLRDLLNVFRQDMGTMQGLAHSLLGRNHHPGP